ncbi:MAG: PEP-CTERM sorting domain-containing protein [Verrucomicrobia bacterium]|nr:PEP-CTERM sorting domain-containing protein [Verrucomicrobiota bacterium]
MKTKHALILFFTLILNFVLLAEQVNIQWISVMDPITDDQNNNASSSYFAQLIWSEFDTSFSSFNNFDPLSVDSGFRVLHDQEIGSEGFLLGDPFPVIFNDEDLVPGFVYTRVFSTSNPTFGDFWGQSSSFSTALVAFDSENPAGTTNLHDPGAIAVNIQIIPEPGTLALIVLAAGGIAMKFRRRRS